MLEILRRKAQSPFIQGTVVIIALVFIFWGVGTNQNSGGNSVATVNDEAITVQNYQDAYERTINDFRTQFGGTIPDGLLDTIDIKTQVLNQLIQGALLRQGAREMGVVVSDIEVKQAIEKMEAFSTNGYFDMQQYQTMLTASRITPGMFEQSMRSDLITQKLVKHLERFTKVLPDELNERFIFENEEMKLEFVSLNAADYREKVKVSDEELADYFEKNKENYKSQPQVKLSYLLFPYAEALEMIVITDADIEDYYRKNLDRFSVQEKRSASHILIKAEEDASENELAEKREQAEKVLALAKDGQDFAELAKNYSEGPSAPKGGSLGNFSRGQMVKPFEDAVFSMEEGAISNIVKTRFGFHIIKLAKIEPARLKTIDESRKQIESTIKNDKARSQMLAKANKAYEDIILAGSLQKYAESGEINILETDFFSRSILSDNEVQGVLKDPAFVNAGFSLNKGELSSLTETATGFAILFGQDAKDQEILAFEVAKDDVTNDLITYQSDLLAKTNAEEMLDALKSGESIISEAERLNTSIQESEYISRASSSGMAQQLPLTLINKGFELSSQNPYPEKVEKSGTTYYIFKFMEKSAPAAEIFGEKQEEFNKQISEEKKSALLAAWMEHLKSKAEIITNDQQFL